VRPQQSRIQELEDAEPIASPEDGEGLPDSVDPEASDEHEAQEETSRSYDYEAVLASRDDQVIWRFVWGAIWASCLVLAASCILLSYALLSRQITDPVSSPSPSLAQNQTEPSPADADRQSGVGKSTPSGAFDALFQDLAELDEPIPPPDAAPARAVEPVAPAVSRVPAQPFLASRRAEQDAAVAPAIPGDSSSAALIQLASLDAAQPLVLNTHAQPVVASLIGQPAVASIESLAARSMAEPVPTSIAADRAVNFAAAQRVTSGRAAEVVPNSPAVILGTSRPAIPASEPLSVAAEAAQPPVAARAEPVEAIAPTMPGAVALAAHALSVEPQAIPSPPATIVRADREALPLNGNLNSVLPISGLAPAIEAHPSRTAEVEDAAPIALALDAATSGDTEQPTLLADEQLKLATMGSLHLEAVLIVGTQVEAIAAPELSLLPAEVGMSRFAEPAPAFVTVRAEPDLLPTEAAEAASSAIPKPAEPDMQDSSVGASLPPPQVTPPNARLPKPRPDYVAIIAPPPLSETEAEEPARSEPPATSRRAEPKPDPAPAPSPVSVPSRAESTEPAPAPVRLERKEPVAAPTRSKSQARMLQASPAPDHSDAGEGLALPPALLPTRPAR
jgi:hypothetical protein